MVRKDKDNQSAASSASKMSLERGRNPKPPRFSLRRFFCRRPSTRSLRSMKSYNEPETRSMGSVHVSAHDRDKESPNTASHISVDEVSHQSTSSVQTSHSRKSKDSLECPLCLQHQPRDNFPVIMTCHHRSCRDCLKQYLKIEITESRINIACPECSERFHPNDIKAILENESLMNKYEVFMLRRVLVLDPDTRWCPAPDCGYAVIASGCASCPKLKCERPRCGTFFCYHCKQHWHPNQTCDAARAERTTLRSASVSNSHESNANSDIKPCPRCGAFIVKMDDGSCNHMTCAVCGAEFCWLCMKEISDLHYLSPSGCTFWGKKPWSRKKKILWQLGTLVGAPVGIALVAGIAVPAMIIGIPVWVGKKLYTKYEHAPKHRRNLIIVGGVTASVVVAPIIAGLAVAIGVPILLAYVYGVVPISLCRSGGCGVTTNSGGVRFEFDDDNDVTVGVSGPYSGGDVQSVEQAPHINNPSIGPSIGEMSLGMTNSLSASGSHMERIGIIHESDRESASHRAVAGTSLTGSLSGSTGLQTRVEVQADMSRTMSTKEKRSSLSSESANFSLDAKSATISFGDNASTKALAGSICTKDRDNNSAVIPPFEATHERASSPTTAAAVTLTTAAASQRAQSPLSVTGPSTAGHYGNGELASKSRHGSPTSSRSVSFMCDEVDERSGSVKKKKSKHVTLEDSIHEQSESGNQATKDGYHGTGRKSPSGRKDLSPPATKSGENTPPGDQSGRSSAVSPAQVQIEKKALPGHMGRVRSTSTDSVTSKHSGFSGASGLPEVEVDRLGNLGVDKTLASSSKLGMMSEGTLATSPSNHNASDNTGSFVGVGAKPKTSFFGLSGSTSSGSVTRHHGNHNNSNHHAHRPVNQIDSCPALTCEDTIAIDKSSESIYNKSISLRTILPDPPPLKRSKVTIDGQKSVAYHHQRSPDSSDSMLNSPSLSGTPSSSGSSSDTSTCGLLKQQHSEERQSQT